MPPHVDVSMLALLRVVSDPLAKLDQPEKCGSKILTPRNPFLVHYACELGCVQDSLQD